MAAFMDMQPPAEGFRASMADDAVRCTHMDAALAKMSCAQLGYFEDRHTELLIRNSKLPQRSPLIHRGYYSRVASVRKAVLSFLAECPAGRGAQIVNLGVGFDTMFFWLREDPARWREDLIFFEVDFPEVLSRKLSAVQKRPNLFPLLGVSSAQDLVSPDLSVARTKELRTRNLRYVSTDMRIMPELSDSMIKAGLLPNVPTLFISECVLVYMQSSHGDALVEWAATAVPDAPSAFVTYEQFNPSDRFGKVMVDNLMRRGCPLLAIHDYPTLESQRQRYLQRGFQNAGIADMNKIYSTYLDQEDVARIHKIELMDEFEEWHLIQEHYFVMIATRAPPPKAAKAGADIGATGGYGGGGGHDTNAASAGGDASSWVHKLAADLPTPKP